MSSFFEPGTVPGISTYLIWFNPPEARVIIPTLHMKKSRRREAEWLLQSHTANQCWVGWTPESMPFPWNLCVASAGSPALSPAPPLPWSHWKPVMVTQGKQTGFFLKSGRRGMPWCAFTWRLQWTDCWCQQVHVGSWDYEKDPHTLLAAFGAGLEERHCVYVTITKATS